jgi:hypothetical protein
MSKQIFVQVLFGFIFALIVSSAKFPAFFVYFFILSMSMVIMGLTFIAEFTTILFDTSENAITQPLPVKGSTISLARNTHIALYLTSMAIFLTFPTFVIALSKFGIVSGFLFLFTVILNAVFTLFLANILYLAIMKFASAEKLKNIVMYFQIVITIFFIGGMQLGSSLITKNLFIGMLSSEHWYNYIFPPVFFSGFTDGITNLNFDFQHLVFIAETLLIPLLTIFVTTKYLTPAFNRKLLDLEQGDKGSKSKKFNKKTGLWFRMMSLLFVHNSYERASFAMIWKMTGRERQFKQTFLPSIGILAIVLIAQFIRKPLKPDQMTNTHSYLNLLYFTSLVAINLIGSIRVGNNRQAIWILKTVPLGSPADFFKGSIKAAFARFFLPFYFLVSVLLILFFGISVLPDAITVLLLIYLMTSFLHYLDLNFPFTMEKDAARGGERTMKIMFFLVLLLPLGYLHKYLLDQTNYSNLLFIAVYTVLIYYINHIMVYKWITWKRVNRIN